MIGHPVRSFDKVASQLFFDPNSAQIGGSMYRRALMAGCFAVILFGGVLQAQNQLSIRAASTDPVKGWKRMDIGHAVWVSPTVSLTAADIQSAQPSTAPNGGRAV